MFRLGEEPGDDLSAVTTVAERIDMVADLSRRMWELTGQPFPSYTRATMPGRVIRSAGPTPDDVHFFATPAKWRRWLDRNHAKADEVWVGFYKKGSGTPSITWPESVDEALCYGWIDGIRKSIGDVSYKIRFTPRRKGSIWSAVNIARVGVLTKEGRMMPAGAAAFAAREDKKSRVYTYEQKDAATLGDEYERRFRARPKAWAFWESQPLYYRKLATRWVVSAKQEATRERRLGALIEDSAAGRKIGPMRRPGD